MPPLLLGCCLAALRCHWNVEAIRGNKPADDHSFSVILCPGNHERDAPNTGDRFYPLQSRTDSGESASLAWPSLHSVRVCGSMGKDGDGWPPSLG